MGIQTKQFESNIYRLYDELKNHVGIGNVISTEELCNMFGITENTLRDYIQMICKSEEFGCDIGSCKGGYYVCAKEENNESFNKEIIKLPLTKTEGNLCWNCQHIVSCEPSVRPCHISECKNFAPIRLCLSRKGIAQLLGITSDAVKKIIKRNGVNELIKRLEGRGCSIEAVTDGNHIAFYMLQQ